MKILVISHSCIVDVNQRVFRELQVRGHSIAIVVPTKWPHQYSRRSLRPRRLRGFEGQILAFPTLKAGSVPMHLYITRPARVIDACEPDVVYIEEEPYSLAAFQWALAARRRKRPAIFYSLQNVVKRYPYAFRQMERIVWKSTKGATIASLEAGRTLAARGYDGPMKLLPLSVDISYFRPMRRDGSLARSLGLRSPVIGFIGRLVPEKGVRVLLDAFLELRAQVAASLLMIGDGPLSSACDGHEGVTVVRGVAHSDIPQYLSVCDVLAVPSLTTSRWKEQFGRVVIEALACGVPVVGSNSGELPTLITGTRGGMIVPEGDPIALARAIQTLLLDDGLRNQLGQQGQTTVTARNSSAHAAGELERALEGAIATPPPGTTPALIGGVH